MTPAELLSQYPWPEGPWLRTNFVYGADGSVTRDDSSAGISGPLDNALLHRLRATCDVVMVGAATASAENYIGVALPDDAAAARRDLALGPPPPLAVVTRSGRIGEPARFLTQTTTGNYLVLTSGDDDALRAAQSAIERSAGTMTLLHAPDGLGQAVAQLGALGLDHVLCEGGPRLAGSLLAAGAVDELCLTISAAIGGEGRTGTTPEIADRYQPTFVRAVEGFVFTRWTRVPGTGGPR